MRKALLILALGSMTFGYSQVTDNNNRNNNNRNTNTTTQQQNNQERTQLRQGNRTYTFTPDRQGYTVSQEVNGNTTTYGKLRRTNTDDGYYIMQSSDRRNVSFGRFDENGNFRAYKYDPAQDRVVEDTYTMHSGKRINPNTSNRPMRANNLQHAQEDENNRNRTNPETDRQDTNKSNMNNHMGTNP